MPEAVSIVTGNQTASAISPAAETIADGETTIARGIHAVAGIGPTILSIGIPQYRTGEDQPINIPASRGTQIRAQANQATSQLQNGKSDRETNTSRLPRTVCTSPADPNTHRDLQLFLRVGNS